jgi:hypothetical protein
MSDDSEAALEQAISTYLATQADGAYLTGYVLVATGADTEHADITRYVSTVPDTQALHTTLGLVEYLRMDVRGEIPDDDDDE